MNKFDTSSFIPITQLFIADIKLAKIPDTNPAIIEIPIKITARIINKIISARANKPTIISPI